MTRPELSATSPAGQLAQWLIQQGLANDSQGNGSWPIYISSAPDKPDDCISVYDTQGIDDGRMMATGEVIEHPGVQIRIRSAQYQTGWNKGRAIIRALDGLVRAAVPTGDLGNMISSVRRGSLSDLGPEQGKTRRLFTINAILTIITV